MSKASLDTQPKSPSIFKILGKVLTLVWWAALTLPFIYLGEIYIYEGLTTCVRTETIWQIGGCNAFGVCAVNLSDFTSGEVRYPLLGKQVCVQSVNWVGNLFLPGSLPGPLLSIILLLLTLWFIFNWIKDVMEDPNF